MEHFLKANSRCIIIKVGKKQGTTWTGCTMSCYNLKTSPPGKEFVRAVAAAPEPMAALATNQQLEDSSQNQLTCQLGECTIYTKPRSLPRTIQCTQCILCTILRTILCTIQCTMLRTKIRAKQSLHHIYIQISFGLKAGQNLKYGCSDLPYTL